MSTTTTTTTVLETDQVKTFRDFLTNYNKLSELCFVDCVWDFTTRSVKPQEEKCALNCMEKYLKMNQRISNRFQEYQITTNEHALAESKKSGGVDLAITKISQTKKIAVSKMGKISLPSECFALNFTCQRVNLLIILVSLYILYE